MSDTTRGEARDAAAAMLREIAGLNEEVKRLTRERDAWRAAVDAYVRNRVWQTRRGVWQTFETGLSCYDTRAEAEAAYRERTRLHVGASPGPGERGEGQKGGEG